MVNNDNLKFLSNAFILNLISNFILKIFHETNIDLNKIEQTGWTKQFRIDLKKGPDIIISIKDLNSGLLKVHFLESGHIIKGSISKYSFTDEKSFFECWKLAEEKIIEELKK